MKAFWCVVALSSWVTGAVSAQYNPELGEDAGNLLSTDMEASSAPGADDEAVPAADAPRDGAGRGAATDSGVDYTGSFRLGLDTILLSYVSESADDGMSELNLDTTSLGIVPSNLGVTLGYAFADRFVAGARVQVSSVSSSQGGAAGDSSQLSWALLPYFEFVFTPGTSLEWLAYATAGLRGSSGERGGAESSQTVFAAGLGGGVHWMLGETVSFDPALELGFGLGSGEQAGTEYDVSGFQVSLRAGLSVWL